MLLKLDNLNVNMIVLQRHFIGRSSSEEVVLQLINSTCMPLDRSRVSQISLVERVTKNRRSPQVKVRCTVFPRSPKTALY